MVTLQAFVSRPFFFLLPGVAPNRTCADIAMLSPLMALLTGDLSELGFVASACLNANA